MEEESPEEESSAESLEVEDSSVEDSSVEESVVVLGLVGAVVLVGEQEEAVRPPHTHHSQ